MRRIRAHLTYANVIATLALFIALGGSSYAAITLPHNSVGSAQIRTHAVGSSELRPGAVHLTDIATTTRKSLRGTKGDTGTQGPAGPAGTPGAAAVGYFAVVGPAGQLLRGNATDDNHTSIGSGSYTVGFSRNVTACAYTATLGTADGTQPPVGHIGVRDEGGKVGIQTYDATGTAADLPFHLIVAC